MHGCTVCKKLGFSKKCVVRGDIKKDAINSSRVLNESLTSADIKNGSLTGADVQDGSIGSADVQDGSLTGADVQDGSIGSADVQNGSLTGADVQDGSISSADVQNDSLTEADLRDESGAAGLDTPVDLAMMGGGSETVAQVVVTAPTAGWVIVNSGGSAHYTMASGSVECSLTTGTTVETADRTILRGAPDEADAVALTELFAAVEGSNTFRLVCEATVGNIFLNNIRLTAAFYPTRY